MSFSSQQCLLPSSEVAFKPCVIVKTVFIIYHYAFFVNEITVSKHLTANEFIYLHLNRRSVFYLDTEVRIQKHSLHFNHVLWFVLRSGDLYSAVTYLARQGLFVLNKPSSD